jgi:glycosyltransferase involved in cell wall biosynthesis
MAQFHITIDARMLNASGIGTYIRNILPQIIFSFPDAGINLLGNQSALRKLSSANNSNVMLTDAVSPVYSLTEQIELFRKTPGQVSLFWSPHYNIPLFIRAKKRLVTIHDVNHLVFLDRLNLQQKIYAKFMMNLAVKFSDTIITVSDFSKSEIAKRTKVDEEKITVIHNGINTELFKPLDNHQSVDTKDKFGLPDKFILFVGNVKPHKNLRRLLTAYEVVYNRGLEDHYLVIAGEKEGFITGDQEIFSVVHNNQDLKERVRFSGYVDNADLPVLYNAASVFVFPSLYEGFGLPPLEAMACGCPTVVSNAASLPEVCGDAAYYVDPHDTESISEGMYKILTDNSLRQHLIKKGLERAKLFSWKKSGGDHITVFEEILNS